MSFLFGPKGKSIFESGGMSFGSDNGVTVKSGNMYIGPGGKSAVESGNMVYTNSSAVTHCGNTWYCNGKTYIRSGSLLAGPEGSWHGVDSDDDVIRIILDEN